MVLLSSVMAMAVIPMAVIPISSRSNEDTLAIAMPPKQATRLVEQWMTFEEFRARMSSQSVPPEIVDAFIDAAETREEGGTRLIKVQMSETEARNRWPHLLSDCCIDIFVHASLLCIPRLYIIRSLPMCQQGGTRSEVPQLLAGHYTTPVSECLGLLARCPCCFNSALA